jgi:endonuclease-8
MLQETIEQVAAEQLEAELLRQRRVENIEPRGKHLLMHLDDGSAIHSHMGMTGSWHVYLAGQPWRKPRRFAALELVMSNQVHIVCFTPKTLEVLSPDGLRRHPWLNRLGPDLLDVEADMDEIVRRFRTQGAATLGEAVMNQSVVCGIGNIYKSESLFTCRLSPFTRVDQCSDDQLRQWMLRAQRLMRRNLSGHVRRTRTGRDGSSKWVYGRLGEPCLECGELIQMRRQSDLGRSTYYCPQCQAPNEVRVAECERLDDGRPAEGHN